MASYFGLLDLADGASGEEAVAKVVGKVVPSAAEAKPPKKKKGPGDRSQQQHPQQHVREEYRREDSVRGGRGRGQGPVGGRGRGNGQGYYNGNGNGNGGYYNGNGDRGYYNGDGDRGYYNGDGDRGYYNGNGDRGYYNGNGDRGYYRSGYDQVYYDNNGQYRQDAYNSEYSYGYGERQTEGGNYNNAERQGNNRDGGQSRGKNLQYRPKEKPASYAASDAELKPEEKLEPAGETKQNEASADNVDGVPASESEKSTGDVAKDDSKKDQKDNKEKKFNTKSLSGSAKKKLKKQNLKKQDSKVDGSKKTTDEEPTIMEVIEEKKKEMTLEEYEKMLEEKKSLKPSKSEEREISVVAFEGLQLLEKKKVEDDAKYKLENGQENENDQRKGKEGALKEVKARKAISIQEYLKPADGQEHVPHPPRRDGFSNGSYRGGRGGHGNGGFSGRSRDNSTEPRVYNSGRGENAIVFHNVDNGQERRDGYNGGYLARRDGYNGGYQDRRDGYNGGQQGGYNGGRGNGGYRQGGYSERSGNGERQQGGYSGNGGHRGYGGNGGYRGRGYPRGRPVAVPRPDSAIEFPALTGAVPTPAQSQA